MAGQHAQRPGCSAAGLVGRAGPRSWVIPPSAAPSRTSTTGIGRRSRTIRDWCSRWTASERP
eukprot:14731855-Alexandrium_andersonii.AAC.1